MWRWTVGFLSTLYFVLQVHCQGGCRDLHASCAGWGESGECKSNPTYMLINCPVTCKSCVPGEESTCVNRADNTSCDLAAAFGLCLVNPSYNLHFCAGSCKRFIDACRDQDDEIQDRSKCSNKFQTITDPDFECGVVPSLDRSGLQYDHLEQQRSPKRLTASEEEETNPNRRRNENKRRKNNKKRNKPRPNKKKPNTRNNTTSILGDSSEIPCECPLFKQPGVRRFPKRKNSNSNRNNDDNNNNNKNNCICPTAIDLSELFPSEDTTVTVGNVNNKISGVRQTTTTTTTTTATTATTTATTTTATTATTTSTATTTTATSTTTTATTTSTASTTTATTTKTTTATTTTATTTTATTATTATTTTASATTTTTATTTATTTSATTATTTATTTTATTTATTATTTATTTSATTATTTTATSATTTTATTTTATTTTAATTTATVAATSTFKYPMHTEIEHMFGFVAMLSLLPVLLSIPKEISGSPPSPPLPPPPGPPPAPKSSLAHLEDFSDDYNVPTAPLGFGSSHQLVPGNSHQWVHGSNPQQVPGSGHQWVHGNDPQQVPGSGHQWVHGSDPQQVPGSGHHWFYGSNNQWFHGSDPQQVPSSSHQWVHGNDPHQAPGSNHEWVHGSNPQQVVVPGTNHPWVHGSSHQFVYPFQSPVLRRTSPFNRRVSFPHHHVPSSPDSAPSERKHKEFQPPSLPNSERSPSPLIPNCELSEYLQLRQELDQVVYENTSQELSPRVGHLLESINYCRFGLTEKTNKQAHFDSNSFTRETSHIWPGLNYPALFISEVHNLVDRLSNADQRLQYKVACGGSLITPNHILTAAHCFITRRPSVLQVGLVTAHEDRATTTSIYGVRKISLHPDYDPRFRYNDLAIIEVEQEVKLSSGVTPYCLPSYNKQQLDGLVGTESGWGLQPNDTSAYLVNARVTVRPTEECNNIYRNDEVFLKEYPQGIDSTLLCAGGVSWRNQCRRDAGGPLVAQGRNGHLQGIGIVSTTSGCGYHQYPNVYARTDAFLPWIDRVIYGACARSPFTSSRQL